MNQWCNVVRWEFKHPQPFLRSREFLWQEGHTVFATKPEADQDVLQALELYRRVYEELLAIPVVKGMKSEKEKFAGALYTTTVEAFVPAAGRSIQGATSHCLGQNFSKMFNITFEGTNGEQEFAWQNSWGLSTRVIGALVMIHADNNGLVLPPRVAAIQVIVMPVGITVKTSDEDRAKIYANVEHIVARLKAAGVRAHADLRDHVTPGWKFNHWELKGVPARFEVGPKDLVNSEARVCIRHSGEKFQMSMAEVEKDTKGLLDRIHDELFAKAKAEREGRVHQVTDWDGLMAALTARCSAIMPWCEEPSCEDSIKERSTKKTTEGQEIDAKALAMGAKSLCIPFEQPGSCSEKSCVGCGNPAKRWTLFGRSY
jgi:prolyl-tRNA synthetase